MEYLLMTRNQIHVKKNVGKVDGQENRWLLLFYCGKRWNLVVKQEPAQNNQSQSIIELDPLQSVSVIQSIETQGQRYGREIFPFDEKCAPIKRKYSNNSIFCCCLYCCMLELRVNKC